MSIQHNFADSIKVGKKGENIVYDWLMSRESVKNVIDVSDDRDYQKKDIDYIVQFHKGKNVSIEIKCDTYYHTGNFFLELISNDNKGTEGCLIYTEADYLFYFFDKVNILYIIPVKELQQWISENKDSGRFRKKKCGNYINGRYVYSSVGLLVNRDTLCEEINEMGERVLVRNI